MKAYQKESTKLDALNKPYPLNSIVFIEKEKERKKYVEKRRSSETVLVTEIYISMRYDGCVSHKQHHANEKRTEKDRQSTDFLHCTEKFALTSQH